MLRVYRQPGESCGIKDVAGRGSGMLRPGFGACACCGTHARLRCRRAPARCRVDSTADACARRPLVDRGPAGGSGRETRPSPSALPRVARSAPRPGLPAGRPSPPSRGHCVDGIRRGHGERSKALVAGPSGRCEVASFPQSEGIAGRGRRVRRRPTPASLQCPRPRLATLHAVGRRQHGELVRTERALSDGRPARIVDLEIHDEAHTAHCSTSRDRGSSRDRRWPCATVDPRRMVEYGPARQDGGRGVPSE